MTHNLTNAPFSRFGSSITAVWHLQDSPRRPQRTAPGLWLCGVHGFNGGRESFRVSLWRHSTELAMTATASPSLLTLTATDAVAEICIAAPDTVRIRSRGAQLRLHLCDGKYNYVIPQSDSRWLVNVAQTYLLATLTCLRGELQWQGDWHRPGATGVSLTLDPGSDGSAELVIQSHIGQAEPRPCADSFDQAAAAVAAHFEAFAAPYRQVEEAWRDTAERAAWLNWSCVVSPGGLLRRPAMLMSKNWMTNIWSWDHAINALALAEHHPQLAWDQLLLLFDHQLPTGQLPDFINDTVRLYNYVKPPIHGWILDRMIARNRWFENPERLAEIYEPLRRWTTWWQSFRCQGPHGLPEYYHGNDSGWDNGTVFDAGTPATAPDCAAFLSLQMETLARLAQALGRNDEAAHWQTQSEHLRERLLRLWDGRRFRVITRYGTSCEASDSVFTCLPIILGRRLPEAMRAGLTDEICRHLTPWGPATEHPASRLYDAKGYWRGPIWAPPTLILAEGLRAAGEPALAAEVARRFCNLCRVAGAFAENFDALTGQPLCDPAYTWTSSVFLTLARSLQETHT